MAQVVIIRRGEQGLGGGRSAIDFTAVADAQNQNLQTLVFDVCR